MIRVAFQHESYDPRGMSMPTGDFPKSQTALTVVPSSALIGSGAEYATSRLNDPNEDYLMRKQYHHSEQVGRIE